MRRRRWDGEIRGLKKNGEEGDGSGE